MNYKQTPENTPGNQIFYVSGDLHIHGSLFNNHAPQVPQAVKDRWKWLKNIWSIIKLLLPALWAYIKPIIGL